MTITHQLGTYKTVTHYDSSTATLTRVIGSTLAIIYPRHHTIEELNRLSQLDDQTFASLAYLQRNHHNDIKKI